MPHSSPASQPAPAIGPTDSQERLVFVDVLRVAIIVMVIAHHAAQAYGPTGGTWPITDPQNSDWFRPFYTVNAAVGMGLLFLLAGYFVPRAYDRKGLYRFLKDRWLRIGLPLVTFMLAVHVPVVYLLAGRPALSEFIGSLYNSGWFLVYLHLWFLGHLLLYSVIYATCRRFAAGSGSARWSWAPPNNAAIVAVIAALALITWIIRWWYPVDKWVPLLGVVAAEPAHLPQYVILFAVGVAAYRGDWLRRLPVRLGAFWLGVGLTAAALMYLLQGLAADQWNTVVADGGLNWPSLVRSTWETVIALSLCIGLIVFFREVVHRPNRLIVAMAAASYAAYILHLLIVIGLQAGIEGIAMPSVVKFALVASVGTILAFGVGHLSRYVPGLRTILGTTAHRVGQVEVPSRAD
ncbi:MAG TPA: acyltransferase family protein [Propionibacteriaceae bacterium]